MWLGPACVQVMPIADLSTPFSDNDVAPSLNVDLSALTGPSGSLSRVNNVIVPPTVVSIGATVRSWTAGQRFTMPVR